MLLGQYYYNSLLISNSNLFSAVNVKLTEALSEALFSLTPSLPPSPSEVRILPIG